MFGILRPGARHSCPSVHKAWRAHLCGLCLTLRDGHGHLSRMATNYDGLILPVLTEVQSRAGTGPNRRAAGPCALRGFRSAEVVPSDDRGARLAAVVSLALAAGKIRDHAADGDGIAARRVTGVPMRATAAAWTSAAQRGAESIGFDTAVLTEASAHQALHGLRLAVRDLDLDDRNLVESLLCDEPRRAVGRAFGTHAYSAAHAAGPSARPDVPYTGSPRDVPGPLGEQAYGGGRRGDLPHLRALSPAVERLPAGAVDRTLLLRPVRLPLLLGMLRLLLRKFVLRRVLPEGLLLLRRVLLRLRFLEHRSPLQKTDEGCVDISCYHSSGSPIIEDGAR
ncbi:hypothetical protein Pth03_69400 [Planotetraspora thailandica]|uniref:Uncharacterized protein n=1 Tax=Planotetraspora thailandica TaxID=487172 RepID=A0A8J3Y0J0_9ACTN|nr:DUF5685 family protein [Planotetraspora thailandica]GII58551.1 hypothetical protein Pth03_69400 [Planotetraspora thailandica]